MIQKAFADRAKLVLERDPNVIGLAVGGSWLTDEIDEFSDLDLILVTKQKVSTDLQAMIAYAEQLGDFLSGFTGEHVGEPRVLICLYDHPLLHVDIKFLTLEEFHSHVEIPALLLDEDGLLAAILQESTAQFPHPNYQWIEDRFWTWVHYALLKIGRGEYLEAYDFFGFLRMVVFGPLLHVKNNNLPRGVRKVETSLSEDDLNQLLLTVPNYDRQSLLDSLKNAVQLYVHLRAALFNSTVDLRKATEEKVMLYFDHIRAAK